MKNESYIADAMFRTYRNANPANIIPMMAAAGFVVSIVPDGYLDENDLPYKIPSWRGCYVAHTREGIVEDDAGCFFTWQEAYFAVLECFCRHATDDLLNPPAEFKEV